MNEEQLKAIWQQEDKISLDKIDFEAIKQKSLQTQEKLSFRLKQEIKVGVLLYVLLLPIFYVFPKVLLLIPGFIAVWVWYLWELQRLYRIDTEFQNFENLKEILQTKSRYLRGYFRRTRYIIWIGTPILLFVCFIIFTSVEQVIRNPRSFANILILTQIVIIGFVEFFIWFIYRPHLVEIEDLLQQLDETQ